ncbi:TrbI/VirB10 family protein [Hyphococcus sp.]|uniref:TrbI/VirB10 family protein n=1 Tax=Hyphococcus sp. TaxID=2038636 RepID=UPI0035C681F8
MSASPKEEPEALELRAKPRPVTRLNRNALMVAAGGAAILIFAAMSVALKPPRAGGDAAAKELYNVDRKPVAEGLDALPKSYADVKPQLGAPLPGDLGAALLQAERAVAASGEEGYLARPDYAALSPTPFRNSPEADAAREAALREAQMAAEAREAGVFFRLASQSNPSPSIAQPVTSRAGSAFDLGVGQPPVPFGAEREQDPGRQIRKLDFLEDGPESSTDNPYMIEDPATPFEVMAGTVIPASLVTGVNSDLPGTVIAQVTQNVYDTVTGQYLLIPQGARLIGRYDSVIAFGQSRALLVWTRIIYPDGASIRIDNMPASDVAGYVGLRDKVDFHTFRLLKGIVLSTLLGVGTELSFDQSESGIVEALRESAQNSANQAGQKIVQRDLDIPPTIRIRPGWPLRVIVHKDLVLRPYGERRAAR